jgi:hypothetical protein
MPIRKPPYSGFHINVGQHWTHKRSRVLPLVLTLPSPSILFGTRLAPGACAPSPLAGEGGDGGDGQLEATPVCTPTLTLPRRGGGDPVGSRHKIDAEQYCPLPLGEGE